ncbi:MAG TPA: MMPL family transporter, partial [Thermodesulfobacteriota bacterium]|nr:MMPL family transporter [Thermodesulfobacteriota bacterium]
MEATREKIFSRIAAFSFAHSRRLILASVALSGLCAFLVARLPFESDVLNLLPGRAPVTGDFVRFLREFGSADSLYIVVERKSGGDVSPLVPFAEILADRLKATGEFNEIVGADAASREKTASRLLSKALLYLSEEDLEAFKARVSDRGIEEQIRSLKKNLSSMFSSPLAARDPLDLLPLFTKNLPSGFSGFEDGGFFVSPDGRMLVIVAKPKGSPPDLDYDESLIRKVRSAEASAREAFGKTGIREVPRDDISIGLTGGFVHALEDSRMIKRELLVNFLNSLAGVILLVFISFRSGLSLVYAFFPLLISPLLTLGLFCPFIGRLSEATGAFSAIILGLSIDFVILLYARHLEETARGKDVAGSLGASLSSVGPGVLTGAVTTTAAYYALLLSDFRGVRELGFLTGTGILISMVCAFFLFPALGAWREGKKGPMRRRGISAFGLENLAPLALKHPLAVITSCAAATAILLFGLFEVKINNDPARLRPEGNPSQALEARVQERLGEGGDTIMAMARVKSPEDALEIQGLWKGKFDGGRSAGLPVARFEALAQFIPPPSQQKKNLQWIEAQGEALNPSRVEQKLAECLRKEGLRIEPFDAGFKVLREMLANRELLSFEETRDTPLKNIEDGFLKKTRDGYLTVAYLHVRPDFWTNTGVKDFMTGVAAVPGTRLTSPRLVQNELEALMARESWKILLVALAAVFVLVFIDFRSLPLTAISLLPVVLACVWTLGIMGLFHLNLNFMNLVVFTMVLGIGVDYGVHIMHRAIRSSPADLESDLKQVTKGVWLAGLTTVWGFGSLYFSSYPGLQSMGIVALLGVGFSLLNSVTL